MTPFARTVLSKVKLDGRSGEWAAYELAPDRYGHWLYSPKGTVYEGRVRDGDVTPWEVGRAPGDAEGTAELHLVPLDGWFVAKWSMPGGSRQIAVDVCLPAVRHPRGWRFVDLELDPFWTEDGHVGVHDQDEFDAAVDAQRIAAADATHALAASGQLVAQLRNGSEPFGRVGWERFQDALGSGLPPILALP